MRILVACRKFDGVVGGVERMSTTLMNEFVARGHDVSLFTWDEREDAKAFYPLDHKIKWFKMALGNPAQKAGFMLRLQRALRVRKLLRTLNPDVVLGFQEGSFVTLKLYGLGLGIPMICAIRESPFRYKHIRATPPFWFSCNAFRLAAFVTVQFSRYSQAFPNYLQSKIKVTPNHVVLAKSLAQPASVVGTKIILCTGRLSPEKNHVVLIDAFALISDKYPDWNLVIVGRGGETDKLNKKISCFPENIRSRINMPGVSDDIPSWLVNAHIFCLPSWWEGFPNSLAEAMAHGLPSIGFKQCDGVCDLIEDGKTGLLADGLANPRSLADKLEVLMSDGTLRGQMGQNAFVFSKEFEDRKIFDLWENILSEAAEKK